jgi:hypothetical protein
MTTLTIDKGELSKTHFSDIEELYLNLQEHLKFEVNLQKKAKKGFDIEESELIDF